MMSAEPTEVERRRAWHALPGSTVLAEFGSGSDGLTSAEAASRAARHGPNRLPSAQGSSAWCRFARQLHNILIYVLLGSACITALLGLSGDTAVILAVVLVNAVIGYLQEGRAESAMNAIRALLPARATVLRDHQRRAVDGETLVPGDVVLLDSGDRVPADLRLFQVHGLHVQEATLTGESMPVMKISQAIGADASLGDRSNMAYSGTLITSGHARGVVVAIGTGTELGRISGLLADVETLTTPLLRQMNEFARWLTFLILFVAALLLVFGYFVAHHVFSEVFMAVVGLSVAAIPEGLPAVLTITLAIGVHAMAKRNAIVRRLPAIESIGAVSVICTDKTGTLTRNELVVRSVVSSRTHYSLSGVGYAPHGEVIGGDAEVSPGAMSQLTRLARAAILCNDAALRDQDGVWQVDGDPLEGALLACAAKIGVDVGEERARWKRTDAMPFDSERRYMAVLCHDHAGHGRIFVKGAPETILARCGREHGAGAVVQDLDLSGWRHAVETIATQGQRVIALAERAVAVTDTVLQESDVAADLVLLGLVGLIDPPRDEAIQAVAECRTAGIRVKMITGDHAATAAAVARQIGLDHDGRVLTGAELDQLDARALADAVADVDVFARTSPEHKLRLVSALQSRGQVVAMTGDGVNDAPALKRADVGIAMGRGGSDAAKEAALMVLADDNFATIVAAVREGRTVYDNVRKVISWTLPTNAGEAATIIVALLLGTTLPVTPLQILWVNLVTATTLGIALAFEPTEASTMRRPPRDHRERLLNGGLVWHIVLVSCVFVAGVFGIFSYLIGHGHALELARTMAVNTLVVMEVFHLFFVRNIYGTSLTWQAVRGTRVVWLVVGCVTMAQLAFTYAPPMQAMFATHAVGIAEGLLAIAAGVSLFIIVELEKQLCLRLTAGASATNA